MSSQREKIYQKIFASNVFSTEQTNRASTGKKVSPMKNRDHFATLAKPPSKAVLHTGKRLTKEKSTDIFNQKKKENDSKRMFAVKSGLCIFAQIIPDNPNSTKERSLSEK